MLLLTLALFACKADPEPPSDDGLPSDTGTEDTGTDSPTDTGTDSPTADTSPTGDTGTLLSTCEETEAHVAGRAFGALWAAPTGEAVALGTIGAALRDPSGSWTDDPDLHAPLSASHLDGASVDEVWAIGTYEVWRRDPATGTWPSVPFPAQPWDTVALFVESPTDITVVTADLDGYGRGDVTVHHHDGATWTDATAPVTSWIDDAARLPDGRIVLAGEAGLAVEDAGSWTPVATPGGLRATGVRAAPDGTLLAFGASVALGDVDGLVDLDPGITGFTWIAGELRGADDVWVLGTDGRNGRVLLHHDGVTWSDVAVPGDTGPTLLALTDDQVLLTGGDPTNRVILSGDPTGLDKELEEKTIDGIDGLAVDDVDGTVWGFGDYGLIHFDGTTWTPRFTGDRGNLYGAASGGVAAAYDFEGLWLFEGVYAHFTELPSTHVPHVVFGSQGTLFALGNAYIYDGPRIGPIGYVSVGTDWTSIDLSGIPSELDVVSGWADAPDDVWIGLETDNRRGALARWDGTTATVVVSDLPVAPGWMARQSDGLLWMALSQGGGSGEGLSTFDGITVSAVPDSPPDVRAAHRMADGTLYVSTIDEVKTASGDEDLRGRVYRLDPDGSVTQELDSTTVIPLVGHGDEVVASRDYGTVAWWATCLP